MSVEYQITVSFDLRNMVDKVGEIEDSLNDKLSKFDINDKVSIRSKVQMFTLQCDREITKKEKDALKVEIEKYFEKSTLFENIKVESIRRQPRKSCIHKSL